LIVGRHATTTDHAHGGAWHHVLRRYLLAILVGNFAWEFAQLPLYTIWYEGTVGQIVFAALHCTTGDVLIAGSAVLGTIMIAGDARWPYTRYWTMAVIAVLIGLAYTVYSEWINTEIRGGWAYTTWMPTLPLVGTGISPLLQWLVVPPLAFLLAKRSIDRAGPGEKSALP
jgi:hypothetical protein